MGEAWTGAQAFAAVVVFAEAEPFRTNHIHEVPEYCISVDVLTAAEVRVYAAKELIESPW